MRVVLQRQCSLIQNFLYVIIVFLQITPLPSRSNTTPLKELSINTVNNLKDQLPSVLSQSDLLKKGKGCILELPLNLSQALSPTYQEPVSQKLQ